MSTSSNSSFTGISNEIYGRINSGNVSSATVSAGSVKTGSLSCERLDFPGTPIDNILQIKTTTDVTPSDSQLSFISNKGLLFLNANTSTGANILFGADTSARAGVLLSLFNINDTVTSRLIKVIIISAATSGNIAIRGTNAGTTKTNVQFKGFVASTNIPDASATHAVDVVTGTSVNDAYILVTKGSPTIPGENAILFTVISKSV